MATAWASWLSRFALAAASIGAAALRFAAAARSTGAARSSPRSTFALTSSSDITSLFGSAVAPSASISSIETRSSSSPMLSSHCQVRFGTNGYSLGAGHQTPLTWAGAKVSPASAVVPPRAETRSGTHECLLVAVVRVRVAAAGLGEAAAHHVADGEDRDVEPGLTRAEPADVALIDDLGGDQDAGQDRQEREELGRLERRLGLRLATGGGAMGLVQAVAVSRKWARSAGSRARLAAPHDPASCRLRARSDCRSR